MDKEEIRPGDIWEIRVPGINGQYRAIKPSGDDPGWDGQGWDAEYVGGNDVRTVGDRCFINLGTRAMAEYWHLISRDDLYEGRGAAKEEEMATQTREGTPIMEGDVWRWVLNKGRRLLTLKALEVAKTDRESRTWGYDVRWEVVEDTGRGASFKQGYREHWRIDTEDPSEDNYWMKLESGQEQSSLKRTIRVGSRYRNLANGEIYRVKSVVGRNIVVQCECHGDEFTDVDVKNQTKYVQIATVRQQDDEDDES